jgi:hypothetical protein
VLWLPSVTRSRHVAAGRLSAIAFAEMPCADGTGVARCATMAA